MRTAVRASDQDLRALAAIVSQDRHDLPDGAEGLPLSLLADLMDQIHCDEVSLECFDSGQLETRFLEYIQAHAEGIVEGIVEGIAAPQDMQSGIKPAPSAWESAQSGPSTWPDLQNRLSVSDRESPGSPRLIAR